MSGSLMAKKLFEGPIIASADSFDVSLHDEFAVATAGGVTILDIEKTKRILEYEIDESDIASPIPGLKGNSDTRVLHLAVQNSAHDEEKYFPRKVKWFRAIARDEGFCPLLVMSFLGTLTLRTRSAAGEPSSFDVSGAVRAWAREAAPAHTAAAAARGRIFDFTPYGRQSGALQLLVTTLGGEILHVNVAHGRADVSAIGKNEHPTRIERLSSGYIAVGARGAILEQDHNAYKLQYARFAPVTAPPVSAEASALWVGWGSGHSIFLVSMAHGKPPQLRETALPGVAPVVSVVVLPSLRCVLALRDDSHVTAVALDDLAVLWTSSVAPPPPAVLAVGLFERATAFPCVVATVLMQTKRSASTRRDLLVCCDVPLDLAAFAPLERVQRHRYAPFLRGDAAALDNLPGVANADPRTARRLCVFGRAPVAPVRRPTGTQPFLCAVTGEECRDALVLSCRVCGATVSRAGERELMRDAAAFPACPMCESVLARRLSKLL